MPLLASADKRGQAHLPDPELIGIESRILCLRGFQDAINHAGFGTSQVGKAGLPPLLFWHGSSLLSLISHPPDFIRAIVGDKHRAI